MEKILLSIVIPTYNRYQYLFEAIKACLTIPSEEFEVVVQDNTENNQDAMCFIEKLNDKRVKYFHKREHISVSENCDMGIAHAVGEYVTMIGDDDSVCSGMIKAAHFCKDNDIDSVCFLVPGFNWPDMEFVGKKSEANLFYAEEADGSVYELDAKQELCKSLKDNCGISINMPRVYHGLVSKSCLDRIYSKIGTYFPGPSPDMANAVAVCLETKRTVFVKDYLMVSGYGNSSGRGECNRQQHYGDLTTKPWLPKDILERWDRNIPAIFSAETITVQSASEALKAMNIKQFIRMLDYGSLYAIFFWHYKGARRDLLKFCIKSPVRLFRFFVGCLKRVIVKINYKKSNKKNYLEFNNITSLLEAHNRTEEMSKLLGYKWMEE